MLGLASISLMLVVGGDNPNDIDLVSSVLAFGLFLLGPIAMIPLYAWCSARIIARTPSECWGVRNVGTETDDAPPLFGQHDG